ncbi:MAG: Lrp/AsnC ligand binding domain-containing protein [Promethearchaeota archaeon]|jgi:DNA-binding Lrp family transcriptional regulator
MNITKDHLEVQRFINNLSGKTKFVVSKNSRAIGLSRQTYQNKLDTLRDQKVITNFTININPDIQPNNLKFVMLEIKTNPKEPELANELLAIPQLRMLDGIIGEFSLFALFIFKSPEEYYQILNTIDNIMAKSYFKKYQIIETIKVFKTNGISLRKSKLSFEEDLLDQLDTILSEKMNKVNKNLEIKLSENFDLNQIAQTNDNIEYNPERFPGLVLKVENSPVTILIFSNGKIVLSGIDNVSTKDQTISNIIRAIRQTGIDLDKKNHDPNFEIDTIDNTILNILRDNQGFKPISTYDIRKTFKDRHKTEISQSTIHNRIKKLESEAIILNYTINFNPKKIGFKGKYLLRIKPKDPSKYNELAVKLDMNKNITDLFRIGEQYGLFAIVRVKEIEDYATFIRSLYNTEEIEDTYTNFVLDELILYTNFNISL